MAQRSRHEEMSFRANYYASALTTLSRAQICDLPMSVRTAMADANLFLSRQEAGIAEAVSKYKIANAEQVLKEKRAAEKDRARKRHARSIALGDDPPKHDPMDISISSRK